MDDRSEKRIGLGRHRVGRILGQLCYRVPYRIQVCLLRETLGSGRRISGEDPL
jgi:hypothetical protein